MKSKRVAGTSALVVHDTGIGMVTDTTALKVMVTGEQGRVRTSIVRCEVDPAGNVHEKFQLGFHVVPSALGRALRVLQKEMRRAPTLRELRGGKPSLGTTEKPAVVLRGDAVGVTEQKGLRLEVLDYGSETATTILRACVRRGSDWRETDAYVGFPVEATALAKEIKGLDDHLERLDSLVPAELVRGPLPPWKRGNESRS